MTTPSGWATQQLAEFLAVLTNAEGNRDAVVHTLERLAESFEADAGLFMRRGVVTASIGWCSGSAPEGAAVMVVEAEEARIEVPGAGPCETVFIPVDSDDGSKLMLARAGYRFSAEEVGLLRGMGRLLALGLRLVGMVANQRKQAEDNLQLVESLRERQVLLERLARIQRKISRSAPLDDVLNAITAGAAELLGDEVVALRLILESNPNFMQTVSSVGFKLSDGGSFGCVPLGVGIGGQAIAKGRLCVVESYQQWDGAIDAFLARGIITSMAAPVHRGGPPIGCLVVASDKPARTYSVAEQEMLVAFAEHASLALNSAQNVDVMNKALAIAEHQAMHDDLTGLPNRACFYERADGTLKGSGYKMEQTAFLLFDLDRFKEINDTLGHKYGDRVLCEIGPRIASGLRDGDTLARLGGDEFCVLLPHLDCVDTAVEIAQRIIALLEHPFDIDGTRLVVGASCGIGIGPVHGTTTNELLQRADVAMYVAKDSGTSVRVYSDELDVNSPARLALLGELRTAIGMEQLVLHFQPKASLRTGEIQGVEALVRWHHPTWGLVAPDQFIHLAETNVLMKPLTTWVLNAALRQVRLWRETEGLSELSMAVNVSTRSLLDESFPAEVIACLERWDVPPRLLELEITESAIMADSVRAFRLLNELADYGVRLSIDDFGTGYSSLAYLKDLPVSQLKIDKGFVCRMDTDPNHAIIVRSVIDLGHNLGLQTVAEGIENQATWDQLASLGCDSAQGFYLARPMAADEFVPWLQMMCLSSTA
ncbi:MAG: hypothetical protein NVS3B12_26480 [Acidimicrobiales bacterium]